MKPGGFKPIQALMRENEAIAPMMDRLKLVSRLQRIFAEAIPEGVAAMSRIASLEGTTLVIAAANGAVATRLKQLSPLLLAKFQEKREGEVTAIRVLVQPEGSPAASTSASATTPEKPVFPRGQPMPAEILDTLAAGLADSPLKASLERIKSKRERSLTFKQKKD